VRGAVEALREAVDRSDLAGRQDAAAVAWHSEPVVRFLSATLDGAIAGVRVTEDGFIAIAAELTGDGPVETRIAERVLESRLAEVGDRLAHRVDQRPTR